MLLKQFGFVYLDMVKTVIKPQDQNLSIKLPKSYVGKNVQLIAYTLDDTITHRELLDKPLTHFASEHVLAKEWLNAEEDKAWQDL